MTRSLGLLLNILRRVARSGFLSAGAVLGIFSLCALVAASGCAKKDDNGQAKPQKGPAPLKKAEVQRGVSACKDFETKVCSCAKLDPTNGRLKKDCDLADERIAALEISNRAGGTVNSSADERGAAISNSRLIIKSCIEGVATLSAGCPPKTESSQTDPPAEPATEQPAETAEP